jgi:uncharacterized protein YecE (DUF72 family)
MIHVGTCGFSYKDWVGPFYPAGTKAPAMLEYYASRFSAVEIDSTYYAIPKPALFESMSARSPAEFRFSVKAPGSVTHVPADASPAQADLNAFLECLEPLRRSGKLGAVLAQFPGAFRPGREAFSRLELLRREWPGLRLVAEFRHRDWQRDSSLRIMRAMDIGWCNVDEPKLESLMRPDAQVTSTVGYVRFHGRNAAKWWKQERSSAERYDYTYTPEELAEWLPRIAEVADTTGETYVFFNNHRNGQATTNARQMADMLDLTPKAAFRDDDDRQLSLLE